jgi:hypothetical protein
MDFFLQMMPREIIKGDNLSRTLSDSGLNSLDVDKRKSTLASPVPAISSLEDL